MNVRPLSHGIYLKIIEHPITLDFLGLIGNGIALLQFKNAFLLRPFKHWGDLGNSGLYPSILCSGVLNQAGT